MRMGFFVFLAVSLVLMFGGHYLVYLAVVRYFLISGALAKTVLFTALAFLSISLLASFFLLHWRPSGVTAGFYLFAATWTGLFLNLLMAAGLSWLVITLARVLGLYPNTRIVLSACLVLAVAFSVYGVINGFHTRVKHLEVEIPGLPEQWKGKSIVQISDVHLGRIYGVGFLEGLVEQVNGLSPDLLVITGDLFDGMGGRFADFVKGLDRFEAVHGVFFVTGNHETYVGRSRALDVLSGTRIRVLQNEAAEVDGLQLVGISYPGVEDGEGRRIAGALSRSDSPRILLFHTPTNIGLGRHESAQHASTYWTPDTSFALNKAIGAHLQLSGHTHHGQLFPFGYLTRILYRGFDYGLNTDGGFTVYTSSGVGTWGPPMRTGSRSEIVYITLR